MYVCNWTPGGDYARQRGGPSRVSGRPTGEYTWSWGVLSRRFQASETTSLLQIKIAGKKLVRQLTTKGEQGRGGQAEPLVRQRAFLLLG